MNKLKIGDKVVITAGKDKGKVSEIQKFSKGKVFVKGVNLVKKHVKESGENKGGIMDIESPLDVSNIAIFSEKTQKASRVKIIKQDNKKVRQLTKCGTIID